MHRLGATAVALLAATALAVAGPQPASAGPVPHTVAPRVTVNPFTGLHDGDPVTVAAHGLPPHTTVNIVECDTPTQYDEDEFFNGCLPSLTTATTDGAGRLRVSLAIPAVTDYYQEPNENPDPEYCRDDMCRVFVEWTDTAGHQSVGTRPMHFVGSAATIAISPGAGLTNGIRVRVTGRAKGSTGHYVRIVEQTCDFSLAQQGCGDTVTLATLRLTRRDTFSGHVRLYQHFPGGVDCPNLNTEDLCLLTAVVLNADGVPDDTFGVSSLGDPGVDLQFVP